MKAAILGIIFSASFYGLILALPTIGMAAIEHGLIEKPSNYEIYKGKV